MPSASLEGKAVGMTWRVEAPSDQAFLLALFTATRAEAFAATPLPAPMLDMLMRQQFAAQTAAYLAQYPSARREIIEMDGVGIGRLVSDRDDRRLQLVDIALAPTWRGRGLGSRLIARLQDEARAAGVPVGLHVASDNVRAASLYGRLGFEVSASDSVYREMRWTPATV